MHNQGINQWTVILMAIVIAGFVVVPRNFQWRPFTRPTICPPVAMPPGATGYQAVTITDDTADPSVRLTDHDLADMDRPFSFYIFEGGYFEPIGFILKFDDTGKGVAGVDGKAIEIKLTAAQMQPIREVLLEHQFTSLAASYVNYGIVDGCQSHLIASSGSHGKSVYCDNTFPQAVTDMVQAIHDCFIGDDLQQQIRTVGTHDLWIKHLE